MVIYYKTICCEVNLEGERERKEEKKRLLVERRKIKRFDRQKNQGKGDEGVGRMRE